MFKQTYINIMHNGIINKTRYDDPGKPKPRGKPSQKAIHYNKKKFQI